MDLMEPAVFQGGDPRMLFEYLFKVGHGLITCFTGDLRDIQAAVFQQLLSPVSYTHLSAISAHTFWGIFGNTCLFSADHACLS